MATTRIMPLHIGKGRTESQAVSDIIDYVENPQKTDNGRLITGYGCDSRTADAEFLLAKRQYIAATGRVRGADDVIAYHVRQSFQPGEITQEEAHRLGVEFAKRFTKGKHAFVVCTHIDKSHTHNHIIWSAVNTDCDRKFRNFWGSTRAVRRLSDTINDPITREQFAAMLWRYAKTEGYDVSVGEDTNILSYKDFADLSEYAISAMQWACGAGVINGTGDGSTLTPQGQATRAQAAVMLMRFGAKYVVW